MVVAVSLQRPQVWIPGAWIKRCQTQYPSIQLHFLTLIYNIAHTLKWLLPFTMYFSESAIDKLIVQTVCEH